MVLRRKLRQFLGTKRRFSSFHRGLRRGLVLLCLYLKWVFDYLNLVDDKLSVFVLLVLSNNRNVEVFLHLFLVYHGLAVFPRGLLIVNARCRRGGLFHDLPVSFLGFLPLKFSV